MRVYRDIKWLSGDRRKKEVEHWQEWLRCIPSIRRKFIKWSEDFDPFQFNEAASVAVLANAASKAGYLAHTEYVALKRHTTRGRPFRKGRCDLWVADVASDLCWAFEIKQLVVSAGTWQSTFESQLDFAHSDAKSVDKDEADRRVGCLIMVPKPEFTPDVSLIEQFDSWCADADVAFRIEGGARSVWIAFSFVD